MTLEAELSPISTEFLKNKKLPQGASTSGIFTIELFTFPGKSWVYDTGCWTHICNTTQGFRRSRKLKKGALSLYMGNGQRAAVKAIGSYDYCFPSGLVIVLHISKKRIEKLQHDGLLNSIDTKSFQNSVSCLSGKMARKPYSHQVERAKDLLGLIHTMHVAHLESCQDNELATSSPSLMTLFVMALVKRDTLTKPDKLEPRSIKCIFVGYPKETMGHSFYYPPENKVFVARNAEFFENSLITQEASRSLEDLEIIQEEDTHPSENTSSHHDEDNQEIDEP
ncbi:hypothetical protein Tco_1298951 [Tanacetum coccineum]